MPESEVVELKRQILRLKDAVEIAREERDNAESRAKESVQSEMARLRSLVEPQNTPGERALCICQAGLVRSAAVAYVMKYEFKVNAIAVGVDHMKEHDWRHLLKWATVIFTVSDGVLWQVNDCMELYGLRHPRRLHLNIGEDRWGMRLGPYNESLLELAYNEIVASGFEANHA